MIVSIDIKGSAEVAAMLASSAKKAGRAAELAIDATAKSIRDEIKSTLPVVFDRPTAYTRNSLKVTPTHGHNMVASVWFKDPDRMHQHYLVPQVEGGKRKLKGFELALGGVMMVPGSGVKLDSAGNVSAGKIRQILSVLGKAERTAGYSANITDRSRRTNRKQRDYVYLPVKHGRLPAGVYERYQTGVGFGAKTKRTFADQSKAYQRGRTRGRFSSAIQARGLRPILIRKQSQGAAVKPLLDFYGIAHRVYNQRFTPLFWSNFNRLVSL